MKDLIKKLVRESLMEVVISRHAKNDSVFERVFSGTYDEERDLPIDDIINEIKGRLKNLEGIDFKVLGGLGLDIYESPKMVYYGTYPKERRDKGTKLFGIIRDNTMTTLYWKLSHQKPGDVADVITYSELLDLIKEFNPKVISIELIRKYKNKKYNTTTEKVLDPNLMTFNMNGVNYVVDKSKLVYYPKNKPQNLLPVEDLDIFPIAVQEFIAA
jgi:hypothetical protein